MNWCGKWVEWNNDWGTTCGQIFDDGNIIYIINRVYCSRLTSFFMIAVCVDECVPEIDAFTFTCEMIRLCMYIAFSCYVVCYT